MAPLPRRSGRKLKKLGLVSSRDPYAARDLSDQRIRMAREGSNFSAGLQVVEPSIQVSSGASSYQFVRNRPSIGRRISRNSAHFFIAALIGVGATFAWQSHGNEAKEMVRTWGCVVGLVVIRLDGEVAARRCGRTSGLHPCQSGVHASCGTSAISACHWGTIAPYDGNFS